MYGIVLIVLMYLMPMGIAGGVYYLVQTCAAACAAVRPGAGGAEAAAAR